ncbi:MAG: hypothetical protein HKP58_00725 [Desulfatitalea sp.]|nr:hypothetical protein [Desulfatitalea sp.]NNJ98913.1 hypothetical protein [Desulfatitalea sp.]
MATISQLPDAVEKGIDHLLDFGTSADADRQLAIDGIEPVLEFIHQAEPMAKLTPAERNGVRGAFLAYHVQRPLTDIVRYVYNRRIPEGAVNPSSVNYSIWKSVNGNGSGLPDLWQTVKDLSNPVVAEGVVREIISPDLHTGAYYEYDLRRTFFIYRQGSKRVFISLSKQIGDSEVGRKGYIVGCDTEWNYLYTQEKGLDMAGLGWVKSKIYDYLSACIYLEDDQQPGHVRVGVFQWLKAGWVGINMVDSHHIHDGMVRYAEQLKQMMETDQMPEPSILENVFNALEGTDPALLRVQMETVTQHVLTRARTDKKLSKKSAIRDLDEKAYVARMPKAQLVTAMMREYVKYCLGKETPLQAFWLTFKQGVTVDQRPLS